jgi:heme exporter protein A
VLEVRVKNLSKNYDGLVALESVNFTIGGGTVLAVMGANGAGKTTLLNCIAGVVTPNSGMIDYDHKPRIGCLGHRSFLYDELTVRENLLFWAGLAKVEDRKAKVRELIRLAGLESNAAQQAGQLSAGMKKRVSLCRALVNDPQLLLLDEPYAAFDAAGLSLLERVIADYKRDKRIVIMASHHFEYALGDCTHIAVLKMGKLELIVERGAADTLKIRDMLKEDNA